jgi:hypothetical protein
MSRSVGQVFRSPFLIAAASVAGLTSALVADGFWDLVSWLTLGAAVAVAVWYTLFKPR